MLGTGYQTKDTQDSRAITVGGQRMSTWIKVEDKMPARKDVVLVLDKRRVIHVAYLTKLEYWWDRSGNTVASKGGVTHWQPLPELPEDL